MGTQRSHFLEKKNSHYHREIFSTPREPTRVSRGPADRDGWRVGRNPPSVPSSICLIGEPAPQAELTGVYIPFHSAMGARFIPRPALHPGRPGEHPIIVTRYRDGYRFCAPTQALARHVTCYASALWVEFPQNTHSLRHRVFCDCSPTRHPDLENFGPANRLIRTRYWNKHDVCCVDSASVSDIAPNVDPTRDQHLGRLGTAG